MKRKLNTKKYLLSPNLLQRPFQLFIFVISKVFIFNYIYLILLLFNYWWFICAIFILLNIAIEEFGHIAAAGGRKTLADNNVPELAIDYVSVGFVPFITLQVYVDTHTQKTSPVDRYHVFAGGPMLSLLTSIILGVLIVLFFDWDNLSICIGISALTPILSLLPLNYKVFYSADGYNLLNIKKRNKVSAGIAIKHLIQSIRDIIVYCLYPQSMILESYMNPLMERSLNEELDKLYDQGDYQNLLLRYIELRRHFFSNTLIDNNIACLSAYVHKE